MDDILSEAIGPIVDQDFEIRRILEWNWRDIGERKRSPVETAFEEEVGCAPIRGVSCSGPAHVKAEL